MNVFRSEKGKEVSEKTIASYISQLEDFFRKRVIVKGARRLCRDEKGIVCMGIRDFLLDSGSPRSPEGFL